MKKLSYSIMLMLAVAGVALINGCSKEEDPTTPENSPTVTVTRLDGTGSVEPGASIMVKWDARKHPDGKDLTKFSVLEGAAVIGLTSSKGKTFPYTVVSADASQYVDTLTIPVGNVEVTKDYTFKVEDGNGKTAEGKISVVVKKTITTTPLATTKTGQFYHVQGKLKGAYNLVGDVEVEGIGAEADKDMKNTDPGAKTPAPDSLFTGSWKAGNSTMYVKDNAYDYANANVEGATTKYAAGSATATVSNPAVNDIYIAKLRGGNDYAVIKITAFNATDNTCSCTNTGKITFEYKKK